MSTTEDHVREAEQFAALAEEWMDADTGWRATMSTQERLLRRSTDLQAAQVHATLAQTLKAAELLPLMTKLADWIASGAPESVASGEETGEETAP